MVLSPKNACAFDQAFDVFSLISSAYSFVPKNKMPVFVLLVKQLRELVRSWSGSI